MSKTIVLSSDTIARLTDQVTAIPNKATRTTTGTLSGLAAATALMAAGGNYTPLKPLIDAIDKKIEKHGAGNMKWAKSYGEAIETARTHQGNGHADDMPAGAMPDQPGHQRTARAS